MVVVLVDIIDDEIDIVVVEVDDEVEVELLI